jgi:ABC-2 type transport system ATP-binding protein
MRHTHAIEIENLCKRYGATVAVDGLSFTVPTGMIFGLLGPNGAGKTTALECIEGLRRQDSGTIRVADIDPLSEPRRLWDIIGVQLQASGLPETMTPYEAMNLFSRYHRKQPNRTLLDRFGLSEKADDQYANLSMGQKRRLSLALAVAHDPEVLFLDEPTAGLDVESRLELHDLMAEMREAGKTIVLATHDMAEAEKLCDRIAILIAGRLAVTGTPSQITAAGDKRTRISVSTTQGTIVEQQPELPDAALVSVEDGYVRYFSDNPLRPVTSLLALVEQCQDELIDLRVERPSLEERFMEITRRQ